jgi:hypothetical protein
VGTVGLVLSALGVVGTFLWVTILVEVALYWKRFRFLRDLPDDEPQEGWPRLAVVFAARDEESAIEKAVRSLVEQDYPDLRVVAVDDRSSDRTGEILDRLAGECPRLEVIRVDEVPPGWLGKTHALQRGADAVPDAEWLLFTDADVVFSPRALRRAVRYAATERADHLTVGPDVPVGGFGEGLFLAIFIVMFSLRCPVWRLEKRWSRAHVGVGAFNLVRAERFRELGGFDRIRLSIDDDVRLGQLLKFTGGRSRYVAGLDAVTVRWQTGLAGHVSGLEKNFYTGLDYRPWMAPVAAFATYLFCAAPHVGVLFGPIWMRAICGVGVAILALFLLAAPARVAWWYALLLPLSMLILWGTMIRSVVLAHRRGGVAWRDRLYPLGELRAHARERDAFLRAARRTAR